MTTMIRRRPTPIADMLGWFDAENVFGMTGLGLTSFIRLEDYVEDDTYVLRAEMPGIDPDTDVRIDVDGDVLTIHGERREETRERNHRELHYGTFSRSVTLPQHTEVDAIKAEYRNGILELRVPIADGAREPRRVPIQRVTP